MIPHYVGDDILMLKVRSSHHITTVCHVGGIKRFLIIFIAVFIVVRQP